jgi:hypothetical protein
MQTMLQALAARKTEAMIAHQLREFLIHLEIKGTRPDGDPEKFYRVDLQDIGEDFIQVKGRMISRDQIIEIEPINF